MTPATGDGTFATAIRIRATPEEVFPYLTDASLVLRWMGDWAELQPEVGGVFALDIQGVPVRGRYLAIEAPHRVLFTWGVAGSANLPAGSTTVEITLRADGNETVVELVHRDLPPDERAKHRQGWDHFLDRLVVVAGGDAGPGPRARP